MASFDANVDYYEILQVHQSARQEIIKRAYHTIVKELQGHPDLGGSHEQAVRVNLAYEVLSDPETRRAYDAARRQMQEEQAQLSARRARAAQGVGAGMGAARHSTPTGRRTTAGGNRPGGHATLTPGSTQTVYCPRCGVRNRVRAMELGRAICGRCRAPLAGGKAGPHEPDLPSGDLPLSERSVARLDQYGEVRLKRAQMPSDRRLHCLRCRYVWLELHSFAPPAVCPRCRSHRWSDFRLFKCGHCGHHFSTSNLFGWPYWVHPECPSCHRTKWHRGCESHPLRWFFNQLNRLAF